MAYYCSRWGGLLQVGCRKHAIIRSQLRLPFKHIRSCQQLKNAAASCSMALPTPPSQPVQGSTLKDVHCTTCSCAPTYLHHHLSLRMSPHCTCFLFHSWALQGSTLNEVALDHLFLRFDKDKDGMLSLLELSRLVEALELSPHTPTPAPLPLSSQALDAQGAGTSSSGGATGPRSSIEPLARSPSMQFAVAAAEAQGGGEGEGSQGGSGGAGSGTGPGAAEKALAPYAHLRHLVDYMADCMDASPAGVSQEAFVEGEARMGRA